MFNNPTVFVASSREAERLAVAVQQNLEGDATVTVWTQDAFYLGQNVIDELNRNLQASDFGIFVFSPDDMVEIRGQRQKSARDNVILELGMFIGCLGKERSFVIRPKATDMRLPTDLLGVVTGEYEDRKENPRAALATVCVQISDAIKRQLITHSRLINQVVENALETVCRAMSVPVTPEQATLRAFIFCADGNELVCRHFWDPNPSDEEVGRTRFVINEKTASRVVVVRCFLDTATRRSHDTITTGKLPNPSISETEGDTVKPLPKGFKGVKGKIKPSLRYILAAPIWNEDGSIWGVVDFDASNEAGKKLLQTEVCNSVIMRLARHLSRILY